MVRRSRLKRWKSPDFKNTRVVRWLSPDGNNTRVVRWLSPDGNNTRVGMVSPDGNNTRVVRWLSPDGNTRVVRWLAQMESGARILELCDGSAQMAIILELCDGSAQMARRTRAEAETIACTEAVLFDLIKPSACEATSTIGSASVFLQSLHRGSYTSAVDVNRPFSATLPLATLLTTSILRLVLLSAVGPGKSPGRAWIEPRRPCGEYTPTHAGAAHTTRGKWWINKGLGLQSNNGTRTRTRTCTVADENSLGATYSSRDSNQVLIRSRQLRSSFICSLSGVEQKVHTSCCHVKFYVLVRPSCVNLWLYFYDYLRRLR
ncbi:hypothetical protein J6590_028351 [Homalodisca vitripennis]|nr:hypothetical protein J6590_028351 [Homalodisca vitripennis]